MESNSLQCSLFSPCFSATWEQWADCPRKEINYLHIVDLFTRTYMSFWPRGVLYGRATSPWKSWKNGVVNFQRVGLNLPTQGIWRKKLISWLLWRCYQLQMTSTESFFMTFGHGSPPKSSGSIVTEHEFSPRQVCKKKAHSSNIIWHRVYNMHNACKEWQILS